MLSPNAPNGSALAVATEVTVVGEAGFVVATLLAVAKKKEKKEKGGSVWSERNGQCYKPVAVAASAVGIANELNTSDPQAV